jgi:hypothetical protein
MQTVSVILSEPQVVGTVLDAGGMQYGTYCPLLPSFCLGAIVLSSADAALLSTPGDPRPIPNGPSGSATQMQPQYPRHTFVKASSVQEASRPVQDTVLLAVQEQAEKQVSKVIGVGD